MKPQPDTVHRLVFVCHGNICRSAFAQAVADSIGVANAGFGLSTGTDKPAHPPVVAAAAARGYDLSSHRTVRIEDFTPQLGDLLVAMEVRHLRKLAQDPRFAGVPRILLGRYCSPPVPHIHDPYQIDAAYLPTCLSRIEQAVRRLAPLFPQAARGDATGR